MFAIRPTPHNPSSAQSGSRDTIDPTSSLWTVQPFMVRNIALSILDDLKVAKNEENLIKNGIWATNQCTNYNRIIILIVH